MFSNLPFHAVVERLKQALRVSSERALALELGLKPAAYYNRKKTESLPLQEIVSVCISRNVSIDWLFTGCGDALKIGEHIEAAPVATVDPQLLGAVVMELERAFAADAPDAKARAEHAAKVGLLAAGIYNKVAFEKNEKLRRRSIRDEAEGFARAARLLEQQPGIDGL